MPQKNNIVRFEVIDIKKTRLHI